MSCTKGISLAAPPSRRSVLLGSLALALSHSPVWAASRQAKQLGEGVYGIAGRDEMMNRGNQGAICNIGVIWGDRTAMLIDSGGSAADAREIAGIVASLTDRPIVYVVNTHVHPDHLFGNNVFKKMGAQIIGHINLAEALAARRQAYTTTFTRELGEALMQDVAFIPPDVTVTNSLQIDLGNRLVDLQAWKTAHSSTDITVFDRASSLLFSGDLVFSGHIPTLDGSLNGWLAQLDELAAIPAKQCVPGHGPVPSSWPAVLDDERRYFAKLQADIKAALDHGIPLAKAVETAASTERPHWHLFDEFNERNAAAAYAEMEWQ